MARCALLLAGLLWPAALPAAQAVAVDRLVAVVEQRALMQSDVELARRLGELTPPAAGRSSPVEQVVERELIRVEVDRFAVADPSEAEVEARLAVLAGGRPVAAWIAELTAFGVSAESVRRRVADDLRIVAYLDQRFTAAAQPTEVEVVERARADGAGVPVPDPALATARAALTAEHRARLVDDWVAGLRRRASVRIVAPR